MICILVNTQLEFMLIIDSVQDTRTGELVEQTLLISFVWTNEQFVQRKYVKSQSVKRSQSADNFRQRF